MPAFKSFYFICKNIIIESGLLTCEFDDAETVIHCNQFDNFFTIKFVDNTLYESTHRFTVACGDRSYHGLSLENPGQFTIHANFMLAKIYLNQFNNEYSFSAAVRADSAGWRGILYKLKVDDRKDRVSFDTESFVGSEVFEHSSLIRSVDPRLCEIDERSRFSFDEDTDLLELLMEVEKQKQKPFTTPTQYR